MSKRAVKGDLVETKPTRRDAITTGDNSNKKSANVTSAIELSKGQSKALRKAQNAAIEEDRLRARDRMENMIITGDSYLDDEFDLGDSVSRAAAALKASQKLEIEYGAKAGFRDSFGNTVASDPNKTMTENIILEKKRAEARVRREAKFQAEADAAALVSASKLSRPAKVVLSYKDECDVINIKLQNNQLLSNKEKKILKKYEENQAAEAEMIKEFESGLANYSLSIGGRGITGADSDDECGEYSKTLSAHDVIVPSFTITAPHRTLFSDASLKLASGRRYGMLGPNGRGKSTLLKYISSRKLPVAAGMTVLMLDQEFQASEERVVDQVLAADKNRANLLQEEENLMQLLERSLGSHDNGNVNLKDDFAGRDDGCMPRNSNGSKQGQKSGFKLAGPTSGGAANEITEEAKISSVVSRLQAIGSELDALGAHSSEAKVQRILTGLGFTEAMCNESSLTLSGGWRVRVSLAMALFMEPHLLLLDEPTNHLDIEAVIWLEDHLATNWKGTLLIVSHDADFLDSICTDIIHVDDMKLNYYKGNVTMFEKMKGQILAKKTRAWKIQQKTAKEFEQQGLTAEKAKKRTMEKMELTTSTWLTEEPKEYRVNFNFKFAEDTAPTISVLDVGFTYPSAGSAPAKTLFQNLRFSIDSSSRIAVVGANGSGKSTLLKLLTGVVEPTEGIISFHRNLRLGIYNQHFEDILPLNKTALEYLTTEFESVTEIEARKYLGMFGLDGIRHLIRIGELSGGQKARVVFAALALKKPHILILDECTNHLDLESIDALVRSLHEFKGGVVLVSHDARLIQSLDCELWVCEGGLLGSDGIDGRGMRVERRGFEHYRLEVIREIARKAERAERAAEIRARKRREEKETKLVQWQQLQIDKRSSKMK